jgi:hypothetical protein
MVGIVFAMDPGPNGQGDPRIGYGCHIHPVLEALHVTPITAANAPKQNPWYKVLLDDPAALRPPPDDFPELRRKLLAIERGRALMDLVDRHRDEVQRLVNRCRRVTVTWHRHRGPAFLNRAAQNAHDRMIKIPPAIEGVTQHALMCSMAEVLSEYGSADLRDAITRHRDDLLPLAGTFDDLHELVDRHTERRSG